MTSWLQLTPEQRRISLEQAFVRSGMQSKAIEKDWWVTLCLKALFQTSFGQFCLFKGGTSLSKGWKLIHRFSEDVDIALAPEAFGMSYQDAPSHSFVKNLKRRGCTFTSTVLKDAMEMAFKDMGVPEGMLTILPEEVPSYRPDKDPQTLFIYYPSLFDPHPYLSDVVRMEFGVRSFREPFASVSIQSILSEVFPNTAYPEAPFDVMVVEPRKTLLEKLFLLHEKFQAGQLGAIKLERQSRHPYDIVSLLDAPAAQAVLEDKSFYDRLVSHRQQYVRLAGVDYEKMTSRNLCFVPFPEWIEDFRTDYEAMQRSMIYGDSPDFDRLMRRLKFFNGQIRLMGTGISLETLIQHFMEKHKTEMDTIPGMVIYKGILVLTTAQGQSITFQLEFHRMPDGWIFEEIKW